MHRDNAIKQFIGSDRMKILKIGGKVNEVTYRFRLKRQSKGFYLAQSFWCDKNVNFRFRGVDIVRTEDDLYTI